MIRGFEDHVSQEFLSKSFWFTPHFKKIHTFLSNLISNAIPVWALNQGHKPVMYFWETTIRINNSRHLITLIFGFVLLRYNGAQSTSVVIKQITPTTGAAGTKPDSFLLTDHFAFELKRSQWCLNHYLLITNPFIGCTAPDPGKCRSRAIIAIAAVLI